MLLVSTSPIKVPKQNHVRGPYSRAVRDNRTQAVKLEIRKYLYNLSNVITVSDNSYNTKNILFITFDAIFQRGDTKLAATACFSVVLILIYIFRNYSVSQYL